jgi:uncharacterized iron-regulated membrane protein
MQWATEFGIQTHMGTQFGLFTRILMTIACVLILWMAFTALVMWWKRRPAGRIGVPAYPRNYRAPAAILAIAAVVCALLPLTGLAIIAFSIIDFLLPKRFKEAGMAQG